MAATLVSLVLLLAISGCALKSDWDTPLVHGLSDQLQASRVWLERHYDTLMVLEDIGVRSGASRLKRETAQPSRVAVTYTVEGRPHSGDLYLPGAQAPAAGIVLIPGAVPEGKDDARLVELAHTLARARFAVLTPALKGYRDLKVQPGDVREVADAFRHLATIDELAQDAPIGIGAFSYAVGPAVLAALERDIRENVRFILGVGGYHDLRKSIRFFTTGYFEHEGEQHHLEASEYGKLVFARSVMDDLRDPNDRAILDAMVEAKLEDPDADITVLAQGLGPEGRTVYELLMNTDPQRTFELIMALPASSQATIAALTLHDKDLSGLKAQLILIHGKNDPLIPFPESAALAEAAPPSQAELFIINEILGHVDMSLSHVLTRAFWTRELPDAWRLLRATSLLLKHRETSAGAQARSR